MIVQFSASKSNNYIFSTYDAVFVYNHWFIEKILFIGNFTIIIKETVLLLMREHGMSKTKTKHQEKRYLRTLLEQIYQLYNPYRFEMPPFSTIHHRFRPLFKLSFSNFHFRNTSESDSIFDFLFFSNSFLFFASSSNFFLAKYSSSSDPCNGTRFFICKTLLIYAFFETNRHFKLGHTVQYITT